MNGTMLFEVHPINAHNVVVVSKSIAAMYANDRLATYSSRGFREARRGGRPSAWSLSCTATCSSWVCMQRSSEDTPYRMFRDVT